MRRLLARLSALFRSHEGADHDLRAEMEAHLAMETDENIRRGMAPDEARRRAIVASGGLTQAAEHVREQRSIPWLESLAGDTRYAVRHFRRTPMLTATMILVLSLGIGTNVVLFTLMNSLATLPPPGIAPDEALVRIRGSVHTTIGGVQTRLLSWPEIQEVAGHTELFSGVAAQAKETAIVTVGDATSTPLTTSLIYTTPSYFGVLNVRPAAGGLPAPEPSVMQLTGSPTAMISDAMWKQQFGGAHDVVGRIIRVNDVPVQIAGVAPPRFLGTGGSARGTMVMWLPLAAYPLLQKSTPAVFLSADSMFLTAVARLRPGVTARDAAPAVSGIAERLLRRTTSSVTSSVATTDVAVDRSKTGSAEVVPLLTNNDEIGDRRDLLLSAATAGGLALLVLLITCTNVSALLVGRAVARRREIGVRLSLGAPRGRLIRQLLTESVLLSVIAAAVCLFVTWIGLRVIGTAFDDVQLVVDWHVTLATCAVAVVTGVLLGLSPALHATRVSVGEVLKSSSSSVAAVRSRLQRALVVAQIALTQPLLVGFGVVVATMLTDANSQATSRAPDRIAEIEVDAWASRLSPAERASRINAVVERVAAMPGVVAALPMQMGTVTAPLVVHPADRVAGIAYAGAMDTRLTAAPKGYFSAFDIPVVRGRDFDSGEYAHTSDDPSRPLSYTTAIVGSDLARRLWGTANPLGRRLMMPASDPSPSLVMVVVGVVDEAAAGPSDVNDRVRVYVPYSPMNEGVIVRTTGPALPMLGALRKTVAAEAPQMPIIRAQTLEQRAAEFRRSLLRASGAVAGGGLLALLLSAIGLYAVVSFAVGQRTREIGIRTALGAPRGRVIRLFFVKGLALSATGLALGLPLSIVVTRYASSMLSWPLTSSPWLGVGIGAVVLAVASVAVWLPSRRASTIDPLVALRAE